MECVRSSGFYLCAGFFMIAMPQERGVSSFTGQVALVRNMDFTMQIYSSPDDENQLQLGLHMRTETLFVGDVLAITSAPVYRTSPGALLRTRELVYMGDLKRAAT